MIPLPWPYNIAQIPIRVARPPSIKALATNKRESEGANDSSKASTPSHRPLAVAAAAAITDSVSATSNSREGGRKIVVGCARSVVSLVHISFVDQIIPPLYQLTDGERERGRQIYPQNEILGRFCRNLWQNNQTNKWPGYVTSPRSDSSAASHCRGELESPEGLRGKGASIYDVATISDFLIPSPLSLSQIS